MKRLSISLLKGLGRLILVATLIIVTFVVTFSLFVFWSPEFHVTTDLAAKLVTRYAPDSLRIGFSSFTLEINRPKNQFWSKTVVLQAKNLCVQFNQSAVNTCIDDIRVAFSGGYDGPVETNQSRWLPHIQDIEPLLVKNAVIDLDLTAFPKSNDDKPSSFDLLGFVRKEILPKWRIEGSVVNVSQFRIKTAPNSMFEAKFDLVPGEGEKFLQAILHDAHQVNGPLRAEARIDVTRPQDWGNGPEPGEKVSKHRWSIAARGRLDLDPRKQIQLIADTKIRDLQKLDFRIQTLFKGIDAIREARVDGAIDKDDFKGKVSLKGGSPSSELQALDFVNCGVTANLEKKIGGVHCGPQAVRLQLRERALMHRPDLFILAPELDLQITNLKFGESKSADYTFSVLLDHLKMVRLGTKLNGHVELGKETKYSVKGRIDAVVPLFQQITRLLRVTPYAIPAPFNTFDGVVGLQGDVDFTEAGGAIKYTAATRLDSDFQSMHLDIKGETKLEKIKDKLQPNTDINLSIANLRLSAPRFELRAPPALKPDSRFGKITPKVVQEQLTEKRTPGPSRFRIHVKTASAAAVKIATNLTKAAVPISVDVTFDDHSTEKSQVAGFVEVGTVPLELFKRNAVVQHIRMDLLGSGDDRLDGLVSVNYGDYAISVLLLGEVAEPQVKFASDPPLDDNQIVSVLLFGRPPYELDEDQQSSAANAQAAMADAVLGLGSLYFLASTPVESIGYNPDTQRVVARVGLGGGASIELGAGDEAAGSGVGFRKRLTKNFTFRSEVDTIGSTGQKTVQALIEWVRRF